jgi:hypothetical protein
MEAGRHTAPLVVACLTLLVFASACSVIDTVNHKPFGGEDEILYGPEAKPAKVNCEESDALEDLDEYEDVWSCEIVFKDGSGVITSCSAHRKSSDVEAQTFTKTCEEWAPELQWMSG